MRKRTDGLVILILAIGDVLALLAIFIAAIWLRQSMLGAQANWGDTLQLVRLGLAYCFGAFFLMGLYPGYGLTAVKELEHTSKAISLAFLVLIATAYLNKPFQAFSRAIVLSAWALALMTLPMARFTLRGLISRQKWYGQNVHLYGESNLGQRLLETFQRVPRLGWIVTRCRSFDEIPTEDQPNMGIAILATSDTERIEHYSRSLSRHYRRVVLVSSDSNFGSLYVQPRDFEGRLGLEYQYHLLSLRAQLVKWGIDKVGALALSVISAPLMLLLAALIRLDSPGPVFYAQERLGHNSTRFRIIKFRTMVVDADQVLGQHFTNDIQARAEYERYHKLRHDPRVTRVGRWLRKYSLDELPQLLNVLRGEMSLVGPRAYMPAELADIGGYVETILRVRPGMTGWWQVLGRHNTTFKRRLQMDEYYISNWSLWMDIYILMKTLGVVVGGTGT